MEIITFEENQYPCKLNEGFAPGRVVYYPGLDTRESKTQITNNLHRLKLLHYQQRTRLENPELYE